MKRGLVIGKFMPIHNGHIALINFAVAQCDEVIVSMSYKPTDAIDSKLRLAWIKEIFAQHPKIKPAIIEDNFDDESLPLNERTKIWADQLKKVYPAVQFIFSSEDYGLPFAENMNAKHVSYDPQRNQIPVSASLIRSKPFKYWDYIPSVVRPYFVKKICFYGPESTGKSTMTKRMAEIYQTEFVPEVARELITSNDFTLKDISRIGYAQTKRVIDKTNTANKILFCDTDVITTEIYSQHYLQTVPEELYKLENTIKYDQYFLFDIDVAWVADDMRDLGNRRQEMYEVFKNELDKRKISYLKVSGSYEERERFIRSVIDKILDA
jgi:HTH-type transcriptional regulator, transcriptional repressor of NAD biosynthesis genes